MFFAEVHSFLKQSFARSSLDIIWGVLSADFQLTPAESTPKLCQVKILQNTFLEMSVF